MLSYWPCLLLAFQCIATIKKHDLWVSGLPSKTLGTFKWVIKSWEIDLRHFIQLKKYYIHWYSPYGPQKKIHRLMIKLHICYRLKSIYPMTYLDNTFPNSSATQAHISFFKIRLVIILTTICYLFINFKKFHPVGKAKNVFCSWNLNYFFVLFKVEKKWFQIFKVPFKRELNEPTMQKNKKQKNFALI